MTLDALHRWLALAIALVLTAGLTTAVVRAGSTSETADARTSGTPAPASSPTSSPPAPSPSAAPSPASTATQEPPAAAPPAVAAALADLERLAAQIHEVRGLPVVRPLDARVVDPPSLAEVVGRLLTEDLRPEQVERERRALVTLGLLPDDVDLYEVVQALYREQVAGLYVPEERRLYVATDGDALSPFERLVAAHEVTHALQDTAFDLRRLRELPEDEADESLALLALIEGDATLTQQLWAARFQSREEQAAAWAAAGGRDSAAFDRAPRYVRQVLAFPYREGALFVSALHEHGGFAAVDAAFARPPRSTAEILHPERYLSAKPVQPVRMDSTPGRGWQQTLAASFGEFDLRELLHPLGGIAAAAAAEGWAGGQVRSWQRSAETAVAIRVVFDDAAQAAEACEALRRWAHTLAASAAVDCAGNGVGVGVAADPQTAAAAA